MQVPVGATADIHIPAMGADVRSLTISEEGKPVWANGKFVSGAVPGIASAEGCADAVVFAAASGVYSFAS